MKTAVIVLVLVAVVAVHSVHGAGCHVHGKPSKGVPNNNPIDFTAPKFVRSVKNGELYTIGSGDHEMWVAHFWGTPYEMGFAHGQVLKKEMNEFMPALWSYMESQVTSVLKKLPDWMAKYLANWGLDATLDLTYEMTKDFTGAYVYEEMQGLADGSGIDYKLLRRIHLLGELTKGACSMYGAWGSAVEHTNSELMQLRALDWDVEGPFKNFPLLAVYHPNSDNGHAFVNVGFVGWIASITGVSEVQLGISEIGVSYPDASFGKESRVGIPFTYILRDILQFDGTLDDAISRLANAHRTCDLILGVGDAKLKSFRSFQYSHSVLNVMDDLNLKPVADWHKPIPDVVYHGMDWICPGDNEVLHDQLVKYHGNITAENTIRDVLSIVETGDLQAVVYDLDNMEMWVSYAAREGTAGPQKAFSRTYNHVDLKALFAAKPPASRGTVHPSTPVSVQEE